MFHDDIPPIMEHQLKVHLDKKCYNAIKALMTEYNVTLQDVISEYLHLLVAGDKAATRMLDSVATKTMNRIFMKSVPPIKRPEKFKPPELEESEHDALYSLIEGDEEL